MWRAQMNYFPTWHNLVHRGLQVQSACAVCELQEEITLHILQDCTFAKVVLLDGFRNRQL